MGGPVQAEVAKMQKVLSFYVFWTGLTAMKQVVVWQDVQKSYVFACLMACKPKLTIFYV